MNNEIWKDIPGYEGMYKVSNFGNVMSVDRYTLLKDGRRKMYKGRVLRQGTNSSGYKYVNLSNGGHANSIRVHRLVAMTFIENKNNDKCINHKDENKANNCVENLEWCTYKYNLTYNDKHLKRSVKVSQFTKDGEFIRTFNSITDARIDGVVGRSNISACCRGIIKSCGGYVWKYA